MLRRYKASVRVSHHHGVFLSASDAPPPRRRGAVNLPGIHFSGLPVSQVPSQSRIHLHSDLPPLSPLHHVELSSGSAARRTSIPTVMTLNAMAEEEDNFNAPLYTLKALAIATAVVSACASASVMGIMSYLGVRDVSFSVIFLLSLCGWERWVIHRKYSLSMTLPLLYIIRC